MHIRNAEIAHDFTIPIHLVNCQGCYCFVQIGAWHAHCPVGQGSCGVRATHAVSDAAVCLERVYTAKDAGSSAAVLVSRAARRAFSGFS